MTSNQIEYWKLLETQRSNRAREAQLSRDLVELSRSNRAKERENKRSNKANERIKRQSNAYNYEIGVEGNRQRELLTGTNIVGNYLRQQEMQQKERLAHLEMAYTNLYRDASMSLEREKANIASDTTKYSAQLSSAAQRYGAELSSAANRYATDVNKQIQDNKLKVDTYTAFANAENQSTKNYNDYILGVERNKIQSDYNKAWVVTENIGTGAKLVGQLGGAAVRAGLF